jgi:NAD(P)-dependent dehydrogenase (short-subunit alcohol dehydrogenase family)
MSAPALPEAASLFDLRGRAALVTGASSGIGRSLARALAAAGAAVVLMARREARLTEACDAIEAAGGVASPLAFDLSWRAGLADAVEVAVSRHGRIDVLVNAAGYNPRKPADQLTQAEWDATLEINLTAPFRLSRALAPQMLARGWGRIIHIASLQSRLAFAAGMPYGASKGGIAQLTRAMAKEWSGRGVTCNAIAPGFFPTELTAPVFADPAAVAALAARTAIGRNGRLEDLHGPLLFRASPASDYVTGQVLYVDGGFTAT